MSNSSPMLTLVGLFGIAVNTAIAQTTTTVLFENTGAEVGITVPGATDFSLLGSNWMGGVVAADFRPELYASGAFAYEIGSEGGKVAFDNPIDSVEFFFVHSATSFTPSPRGGAYGVWLGAGRKMLLFGGMSPITGDTIEYDADTRAWRELAPELQGATPAARCHHTLVSDGANDNIVMFGGFSLSGRFNDVWRFEPEMERWSELFPSGVAPAPRCLHAATYVPSRKQMLVYGGVKGLGVASADYFADTHVLDLDNNEWTVVNTSEPGKLRGAIVFYSTTHDAVYLWGGKQVSTYPTTLWRFDVGLSAWESVAAGGDIPLGREDPAFFWDDAQQRLILFSGYNDFLAEPLLSDLHILDLGTTTWQVMPTDGIPPARWRASVVFDPVSRTGFMFGGWSDFVELVAFNDTWQYDAASMVWSPAQASDFAPGIATAFDSSDAPITSINSNLATVFGDPNNFVTLDPANPIARIEFFGGVIDNFSFSEAAIPAVSTYGVGAMTLLVLTAGTLVLRRRAGPATRAGQ